MVKRLTARSAERVPLAAQLRDRSAYFTAALDNEAFSAKQRLLIGKAAQTLIALADAASGSIGRPKRKALRALKKLLKAV